MKANSAIRFRRLRVALVSCLAAMLVASPAFAANTDISNIPLANASSVTALPNIFFILDDSGSMAWQTIPGATDEYQYIPRVNGYWASAHCNGLGYDPNVTYSKPPSLGTTTYSDVSFSAAPTDGYTTGGATTNLTGSTYYKYTGSQADLDFTYDGSGNVDSSTTFYKECNSGGSATIAIPVQGSSCYVSSIKVGTTELMSGSSSSSSDVQTLAASIDAKIRSNSSVSGYTDMYVVNTDYWGNVTGVTFTLWTDKAAAASVTPAVTTTCGSVTRTSFPANTTTTFSGPGIGKFTAMNMTAASSDQQNYANWYSYYRVRISMAKSAIASAFKDVRGTPVSYAVDPTDGDYFHARIGYDSLHRNDGATGILSIANFDSGTGSNQQKKAFFDRLYAAQASGNTPLRTALQAAGVMYQDTSGSAPIQYKCQRSYTILETDGYWNTGVPSNIGNQDGDQPRPMYDGAVITSKYWKRYVYSTTTSGCWGGRVQKVTQEQQTADVNGAPDNSGWTNAGSASYSGSCKTSITLPFPNPSAAVMVINGTGGSSDTLADVAMYYYKTDLRTDLEDAVPPTNTTGNPNIDDTAAWQHMTTFTVGLGVDGTLKYDPGYKTPASGTDFYNILCASGAGCTNWPVPPSGGQDPTTVDDLWHAAVDGHGTYFSAKNPKALSASLKEALSQMKAASGSGSAAGTSNLNPTAGSDFAYTPSYVTGDWTGDLLAYPIQSDGTMGSSASWSASAKLKSRITAASGGSDRVIYTTLPGESTLKDFKPATFTTTAEQAWFDNSALIQYSEEWNATQKAAGTWDKLVNYLRGDYNYERRSGATQQLYRTRTGPIGDIIHSQPIFVGKPAFAFEDSGYAEFKAAKAGRPPTVYVGANDGMLHAFNANDGTERWAYVPPMVLPNLWRLADRDYGGNHHYFVDGPIAVSDAFINGAWATVVVGSMGAGGRGYYALDVTDPASPKLLWTFSADDNANVGYTFGTPVIVKVGGTWAAVLTSGYNNVPESGGSAFGTADGKGYVFVRKLADGSSLKTIATGAGSSGNPSGLATANVHVKSNADYTAQAGYGGDLTGAMYRFDLSAGTVSTLISVGSKQPITSAPEIATIADKPVVYFGTGRYLGKSDMVTTDTQAIYAVKDDVNSDGSRHTALLSELVKQTLSTGGVITATSVDWGTKYGWYVELPNGGERVNIHPQLQLGVVLFLTTVPPTTASDPCTQGGGSGWLYQFSYLTGGSVNSNTTIGTYLNYLPVGLSLMGTLNLDGQTADGKATVTQGSDQDDRFRTIDIMQGNSAGTKGEAVRVLWRELLK